MGHNLKLHPKYKQWIIRITVRYVGKHALCKQRARGCVLHMLLPPGKATELCTKQLFINSHASRD